MSTTRVLPYILKSTSFPARMGPQNYVHFLKLANYFKSEELIKFGDIYFDVIESIAAKDVQYLENVCEKTLYNKFLDGFETIEKNNLILSTNQVDHLIHGDFSSKESQYDKEITKKRREEKRDNKIAYYTEDDAMNYSIDARAVFGPEIDRELNIGKNGNVIKFFPGALREYHFNFSDLGSLFKNQVLVLNIHYTTRKALKLENSDGIELGNDLKSIKSLDELTESHVLRFETQSSESADWILTDFDDCLESNHYYPDPKL